ncbi:MAG: ATP-binding protein [Armatimonadota bacterium]|nr:ATP-binding protein [Armatimonadota bacterium]
MAEQQGIAVAPDLEERDELHVLRSLLRALDYGILFTDAQRRDIVCNGRFSELFSIDGNNIVRSSPEAVRSMVFPRLADPEGFVNSLETIYADPLLVHEDEIELTDPLPKVLRRYTAPVTDECGEVVGRLWTFLDITRTRSLEGQVKAQAAILQAQAVELASSLKATSGRLQKTEAVLARTEKQLLESEKLSAVGLLAASVAHDIGNILTPVSIETSLADSDDHELRAEALQAIQDQVGRLSILTHRLLAFAKPGPVEAEAVEVPALLDRLSGLLTPHAASYGLSLETRYPRQIAPIRGDTSQLEQVLVNLALNGMQAMQEDHQGKLEISARYQHKQVCLQVTDTGHGIPPGTRRRLFDPFFTTKPQGAGLGLFSCRRIVEAHGGTIRVRSEVGKGTRFSVWLPAFEPTEAQPTHSTGETPNGRKNTRR